MKRATQSPGKRIFMVWAILVAGTLLTWSFGESGLAGAASNGVAVLIFAIALIKARYVALDYMELRHAPSLFRRLMSAWIVTVAVLIVLARAIGAAFA